MVGRIGGDEFAIFLGHMQRESDAATIAARILERLSEPFYSEGRRMLVSASIGIALGSTGVTPEELLHNADTAMYHAKTNGKARFEFFDQGLREQAVTRFEIETGLRKAIDAQQLVVHYQPIVSASDGRLRGFEALIRWNHPARGLIPPSEFIPVAEGSDLIVLLGCWVLVESCRQMAEWQKSFASTSPLTISVNVSARQLNDSRLVEGVEFALAGSGLNPESLALEMTESSIMGNTEQTLTILHRLKAMNVRPKRPGLWVVDGQPRTTALCILCGRKPYWWSSGEDWNKSHNGLRKRPSVKWPDAAETTKKPPGNRAAFSLRENSSNGGKAIRTFWRNSMVASGGCQGKIRRGISGA